MVSEGKNYRRFFSVLLEIKIISDLPPTLRTL